ncbi:MAG: RNase P subunit p30 family protein [Candidatus Altiarchaeota archaeon]|nr:RNase P subunit p30 family protein [Candidatus Altiarchaeota archaeon]
MMKHKCYDLNVDARGFEGKIELAGRLEWDGICLVKDFDSGFKSFSEEIAGVKKKSVIDILLGARISTKIPGEIQKKSRAALEYADLILADGGDEDVNRVASECWEVDVLCHPEKGVQKDYTSQRSSGLNHVSARFMAERYIALELNFSEILCTYGVVRSQVMGRMRQNVMLARKYGVPLIISSGAVGKSALRSPRELMAVGLTLGMDAGFVKRVMEYPLEVIKKSRDRKNPDVLMKGLEVVDWGDSKPKEKKKMYGWY